MRLPLFSNKIENQFANVIVVAAGKGGVGKSMLAVMLAWALKKKEKAVGLLDADLYGPTIRKMVPYEKAATTIQEQHKPAMTQGLLSLSFADFKNSTATNSMRAPLVDQWVKEFTSKTAWGNLDYLIIDCPPGTGDILLSLTQRIKIDQALIVTTPQEIALIDVRRTIKFFEQMNIPIMGLVENMSYLKTANEKIELFGSGGGASLSNEFKIPLLAELPFIPKFASLCDKGFHLFESNDPDFDDLKSGMQAIVSKINNEKALLEPIIAIHDEHAFSLKFADGEKRVYHLGELQQSCPCANCQNQKSSLDLNLRAKGVNSVGRYAIKIDFEAGCSNGIYPFKLLKTLGKPL